MSSKLIDTAQEIYAHSRKRAWEILWTKAFFDLPRKSPIVADIHKYNIDASRPHAIWKVQNASNKYKIPFYFLTTVTASDVKTYKIYIMGE